MAKKIPDTITLKSLGVCSQGYKVWRKHFAKNARPKWFTAVWTALQNSKGENGRVYLEGLSILACHRNNAKWPSVTEMKSKIRFSFDCITPQTAYYAREMGQGLRWGQYTLKSAWLLSLKLQGWTKKSIKDTLFPPEPNPVDL